MHIASGIVAVERDALVVAISLQLRDG